jgi:hypothetical protein
MVLSDQRLPLRRDTRVPATWQPRVRAAALRGVAVLAAGTLAELAARRLVRGAARRVANVTRLPLRRRGADVARNLDDEDAGAQLVSDTLFVRRLRVKR